MWLIISLRKRRTKKLLDYVVLILNNLKKSRVRVLRGNIRAPLFGTSNLIVVRVLDQANEKNE